MSKNSAEILLIESPDSDFADLIDTLKAEFSVVETTDQKKAIDKLTKAEVTPGVVLIDATLPDANSSEVCEKIKQQPGTEATNVIVINREEQSLSEKLKSYDAGADDIIFGKLQPEEIALKVRMAMVREQQIVQAEAEKAAAMDTAMTAIMNAGEQASIIHFMRESFKCTSVASLAELIVDTTAGFGLNSVVQIDTPQGPVSRSNASQVSPLESQILAMFHKVGRIHQRGSRLILSFGDISQLIKNLPLEDEDKCGRFRDHIAVILEGAVSRLKLLLMLEELDGVLVETNKSLADLSTVQSYQKKRNIEIMDTMSEEIQNKFFNYGLTDEQEQALLAIVGEYSDQVFQVYEEGMVTDTKLRKIAERIQQAAQQNS